MVVLLAEDKSDFDSLKVLIRRALGNTKLTVEGKGYGGCGELRAKGAKLVTSYINRGANRFVICHDADKSDPQEIEKLVREKITRPSQCCAMACIVVPVEELESWVLADEVAVQQVIPSFVFKSIKHPETIRDAKEHLEDLSRQNRSRPLYLHTIHNPRVAEHLDFAKVAQKCASFRRFSETMRHWQGEPTPPPVVLYGRWGGSIESPSSLQVARAINELANEDPAYPTCVLALPGVYRLELSTNGLITLTIENQSPKSVWQKQGATANDFRAISALILNNSINTTFWTDWTRL